MRQMRYLVAVGEELNFTRAAERCHISQPPLSRAIRELESEIGTRLFDRDKHHVALTPAGASLMLSARKALAALDDGIHLARRTGMGLSGTLTFGFGGSTVYSLLPSLVRRFRETTADVELRFSAMSVLHQIEALRSGEIDVGILRLPIFDELIETRFVHSEPLVAALPLGHPLLAHSGAVSPADLRSSRFVTYESTRGFNFQADLLALCRLANFDPEIAHEAPTTEAVIGIVACGEGVAIVPASAERLRMRGVAFRPLEVPDATAERAVVRFALAWRAGELGATTRKFIDSVFATPGPDPTGDAQVMRDGGR
ncbi:LysR family transcriptional regulator [Novosphingobium album (ex Liu et al. 2023)]|uniref:LysR substrate-binding domain-containing protein n=1 Tax=Novosphingobium album (ex Liu et al. 2023) TaxID=3031130 RepID=UPI0023B04786|nr:LysR family transcriptional regulator [Novosphingobium album (ex Liu et al. 2023)]